MKRLIASVEQRLARLVERWRPRSLLGRTVLPVIAGAALIAAMLGLLWIAAAVISRGDVESSERLMPSTFEVGRVATISAMIARDGPLLFPALAGDAAARSIVLDHTGDTAEAGWVTYWGYPAGSDASCPVSQVAGTRQFVDPCTGDTIDVTDLARTAELCPIIDDGTRITIGLRATVCAAR